MKKHIYNIYLNALLVGVEECGFWGSIQKFYWYPNGESWAREK